MSNALNSKVIDITDLIRSRNAPKTKGGFFHPDSFPSEEELKGKQILNELSDEDNFAIFIHNYRSMLKEIRINKKERFAMGAFILNLYKDDMLSLFRYSSRLYFFRFKFFLKRLIGRLYQKIKEVISWYN